MNKLALALLLGSASAIDTKYVQIVEGMLKGALDAEGFDDIVKCLGEGEVIIKDAEKAYADFSGHPSIDDVIDGIEEIADILKQVKYGMKDCSHIKADWEKLEQMAVIFDSPTSFAYHVGKDLLINGV
jgi:hypothetical protein